MEIIVKIEAPGLMEALLAIAEELRAHNINSEFIPGTANLRPAVINAPVNIPSAAAPVQPDYVNPAPTQAPPQAVTPPATQSVPQTPPAPVVPTADAPSYTQQDMAMACVQLMDLKGQARIMEIMGQFGVQALTQLDKSQYGALAQVLRNEGVNI